MQATVQRGLKSMGQARMARGGALLRLLAISAAALGCAAPATAPPYGTPPASLAGHPLIGSWTTTVTRADIAAGGATDAATQNENAGRFTWTFAPDGTWTSVQESLDGAPVMNPVFRGTFVVDAATLIATTTFPAQYADTGLHYTWSIDGDALRLDVLDPPDPIMPLIVETHPWQRAG